MRVSRQYPTWNQTRRLTCWSLQGAERYLLIDNKVSFIVHCLAARSSLMEGWNMITYRFITPVESKIEKAQIHCGHVHGVVLYVFVCVGA